MTTVGEICEVVGGKLEGNPSEVIHAPSKIEEGGKGTISFLSNGKYKEYIYTTTASAVLVADDFIPVREVSCSLIRVANVYQALATLLDRFAPSDIWPSGISNLCSIAKSAKVSEDVAVGDFTAIKSNAVVEAGTLISDQVYIGKDVQIGRDCLIYPGVKIMHGCQIGDRVVILSNAVIGSDGFGFTPDAEGRYSKIPQIGIVRVGDDVEIGASCTIDRASMGETYIGNGVKLDNQIQVAHNVKIGDHTVVAAQAGVAGSTKIGGRCIIGGQVGIVGHISIADGTLLQAQSGVASSIKEPNKKWYGYPAIEYQRYLRSFAYFRRLPEIVDTLRKVERQVQK